MVSDICGIGVTGPGMWAFTLPWRCWEGRVVLTLPGLGLTSEPLYVVQREVSLFSSLYFPLKTRSMSVREKVQTAELLVPPTCLKTARGAFAGVPLASQSLPLQPQQSSVASQQAWRAGGRPTSEASLFLVYGDKDLGAPQSSLTSGLA